MKRKAIIFGIKGTALSKEERNLIKHEKPWGIILFSRNIRDLDQLKNLINDIKNIFKDKYYPILIDQEGGSVSRMNNIIDFSLFSQNFFGELYKKNKKGTLKDASQDIDNIHYSINIPSKDINDYELINNFSKLKYGINCPI